jgi:hypothetical protein
MLIPAVVAVPVFAKMATSLVEGDAAVLQFAVVSQAVEAPASLQVVSAAYADGAASSAAMAVASGKERRAVDRSRGFITVFC